MAAALAKVQAQLDSDAKAARQMELKQRLAQAVKDGKITQAQADAIEKAADAGVLTGGLDGPGGHGPHR